MIYRIEKIIKDIRIAMDENRRSDGLISEGDVDTLSLDEIVRSKVEEAARMVVAEAPVNLLGGGLALDEDVFWYDNGTGWLLLPDDFLRLVVFKMSDWERPVFEVITEDDGRYRLQFSRYRGIRGTAQKPVVAVVRRPESLVLEFFSCKDNRATVERGSYVRIPRIDRDGGIDIPERCYRSVVYLGASLTLASMGQGELSQLMANKCREVMI